MLIVIVFSLLGGVVSLLGGLLLLSNRKTAATLARYASAFAAGALLAAVFLDLLPEGIAEADSSQVLLATLSGIVAFFFLERFLHWFHHHHADEIDKQAAKKSLIIIGDTVHNALDGVAIAAAFLVSVPAGIVTTIAVAAHEIPQEIGDFGLLLAKGMRRRNVVIVNVLSALSTTVLAVLTFSLGSADVLPIGWLLGLSAGFLLYIAMSDLIPTIHEESAGKRLFDIRPLLLVCGLVTVAIVIRLAEGFIVE